MITRSSYLISTAGHFLILTAAFAFATFQRPQLMVPGVRIVSMGGGGSRGGASASVDRPQPTPEPVVTPVVDPPKPVPVVPEKPVAKPVEKAPPTHARTQVPDPRGALPQTRDGMVSKTPAEVKPQARPSAQAAGASRAGAGTGTAGSAGPGRGGVGVETEGEAGEAGGYLALLRDRVAAVWQPPPGIGRAGEARAVVFFIVGRGGGAPQRIEMRESSQIPLFDRAAMASIYNAAPLPPLPGYLDFDSIGIRFTFTQNY